MKEKIAVQLQRIASEVSEAQNKALSDSLYASIISTATAYAKKGIFEYKLYPKNDSKETLLKVKSMLIADGFHCSLHDAQYRRYGDDQDDSYLLISWNKILE